MNLLRRIFGITSDSSGGRRTTRRPSHVTPSNSRRLTEENVAEASPAGEIADEATGPLTEVAPTDLQEQAVSQTAPAPQQKSEPRSPSSGNPVQRPTEPATVAEPIVASKKELSSQPSTYGIASDIGMLRDNNEDSSFAMHWHSITVDDRPDFGFFVVADGMGGHLDGEKASGIAVQILAAEMMEKIYVPLLRDFHAADSPTILDALVSASEKANLAVIKRVPGGGTTLSTVAVIGNLAYLVHVGDSRAYLIHDDTIEQLTTDHTLVQRLIEMKELTPEEAEFYPQKNVLYRAIGQNEQLKVERLIRTLPPSSQVLICSDGLWDLVKDETIKRVALHSASPQRACDELISIANERGGTDNITVIILKTPGSEPLSSR